jgi:hypothetical protein
MSSSHVVSIPHPLGSARNRLERDDGQKYIFEIFDESRTRTAGQRALPTPSFRRIALCCPFALRSLRRAVSPPGRASLASTGDRVRSRAIVHGRVVDDAASCTLCWAGRTGKAEGTNGTPPPGALRRTAALAGAGCSREVGCFVVDARRQRSARTVDSTRQSTTAPTTEHCDTRGDPDARSRIRAAPHQNGESNSAHSTMWRIRC